VSRGRKTRLESFRRQRAIFHELGSEISRPNTDTGGCKRQVDVAKWSIIQSEWDQEAKDFGV
jgi:hypothetical protein